MSQGDVLIQLALHVTLTVLPALAAALIAARLGVRHVTVLLAVALAASGATAMITFWAFYLDHGPGLAFSWFLPFASIAAIGWSLRGGRVSRTTIVSLRDPFALWILGTAFIVFLGFLHGVSSDPLGMAANRFNPGLPSDSGIPGYFATWFYANGHHGIPPIFPGNWLASDRPPLQIGYTLSQLGIGWDHLGIAYEVLGVALQQMWILGLWALLAAFGVRRETRALAMVTVLVSDLAIQHSFYIWPKLMPAGMLLAAAALVISPAWREGGSRRPLIAVLSGALAALAMLGHGSSIFGIIPLAIVALVLARPTWRWLLLAVVAGVVLYLPWSEYQHYGDPPGNRLVRWQIGGDEAITGPSTLTAIENGYRAAGVGGTIHNKVENYEAMIGGVALEDDFTTAYDQAHAGQWGAAVNSVRNAFFFFLLPSLGLLLIVPILMAIARWRHLTIHAGEWRLSVMCGIVLLLGSILWGLILFGSPISRTIIHQGSLLLPLVGLAGAAIGLCSVLPRFARWFLSVNAALMLALYVPAVTPAAGTSYSAIAAVLSAVFLATFAVIATRSGRPPTPATAPAGAPALTALHVSPTG